MSATKQPVWKYLANLGDASPLWHGGAFVMEDTTGVYPPELWIYEEETRTRSTILLEPVIPCPDMPGQYSDNRFHPKHPAWWSDELESVASFQGMEIAELADMLTSDEPIERAVGYQRLAEYFGTYEFDQYPDKFTSEEEAAGWIESVDASLV